MIQDIFDILGFSTVVSDVNCASPRKRAQSELSLETAICRAVNSYRSKLGTIGGRQQLVFMSEMAEIARGRSDSTTIEESNQGEGAGHKGWESRFEVLKSLGYRDRAENVGGVIYSSDTEVSEEYIVNELVNGWLNSQTHKEAIEGDYQYRDWSYR